MSPSAILFLYLVLALADLGLGMFLTSLNYRSVARRGGEVPKALRGSVSKDEAAKSAEYSKAKMRLSLVQEPISTFISVALAAFGVFGLADIWIGALGLGAYWRGAFYLGAVLAAESLLAMPFDLYGTFAVEKRFGFNTTTLRTWLLDALKGALVSAVLGLPLLYLLYAFIDGAGELWWLWAAALFSFIEIGISFLYPLVIAPLFNKFSPLSPGSLADRIGELARRSDFRVSGIFVMDGSKRSRHSNAYFTGLGSVKRIVLYDTLIAEMSEEEILAVLAHEIGHEKKRHVLKMTALSVALSFAAFWILSRLMLWDALYAAFGFSEGSKHALLLIVSLASGPATFILAPAFSAWSRKHEYEADAYAAAAAGPKHIASALTRLGRENASNLWPHPWYSFWHYSHPTLCERLSAIEKAGPASG